MAELTIPPIYRFGDNRVEILPYFLYEVIIYKMEKNRTSILGSKFYKSDKELKIKKDNIIKNFGNYSIVKQIDVLGVTKEFVEQNNLPQIIKKKKNERTH